MTNTKPSEHIPSTTGALSDDELADVVGGVALPSSLPTSSEDRDKLISGTLSSPRDASSGLPTGKRTHKPISG